MSMKQRPLLLFLALISVLLLYSIHGQAKAVAERGGEKADKLRSMDGIAAVQEEISWDFSDRMGLEECDDAEQEECMRRRLMIDAHLDYIYTQHLKP